MKNSTAKVEYRDNVELGYIVPEFCRVYFYGLRKKEMEKKWKDIELNEHNTYNALLYEENKVRIHNLYVEAENIYKQVKESKPFYRFWYNEAEKAMIIERYNLVIQAKELEIENGKIKLERFSSDVYKCHKLIEKFLQNNGFVRTITTSEGEEYIINTEIWVLEEQ